MQNDTSTELLTTATTAQQEADGTHTEGHAFIIDIINVVLMGMLMVWIGAGNSLVVAAVLTGPRCSMHTFNNYLTVQLAMADLSVALSMPIHMTTTVLPSLLNNIYICVLKYALLILSIGASVCALLAMTYDRLSSVLRPLTYNADITLRRAVTWSFIIWTLPTAASLSTFVCHTKFEDMSVRSTAMLALLTPAYTKYFLFPTMYTFFTLLIVLNMPILRVVYRQSNAVVALRGPRADLDHVLHRQRPIQSATMVTLKASLMVYAAFFMCWLPYALVHSIALYGDRVHQTSTRHLGVYTSLIAIMNSGINPIIYAYNRKDFRRQFRNILRMKNEISVVTSY